MCKPTQKAQATGQTHSSAGDNNQEQKEEEEEIGAAEDSKAPSATTKKVCLCWLLPHNAPKGSGLWIHSACGLPQKECIVQCAL